MNIGLIMGCTLGGLGLYAQLVGGGMNHLLALGIMILSVGFVIFAYIKLHSIKDKRDSK